MMISNQDVGRCLAELRRRFRITQDEVAERLAVSRQAVSKWETGASIPEVGQLLALSEMYGVTVNDILRGDAEAARQHGAALLHADERRSRRVAVIGAGRWGSFLAWYLDRIGHRTTLIGRCGSDAFRSLCATRSNGRLTLPGSVELTTELSVVADAEIIVISVPAQSLGELTERIAALGLKRKIIVLCMKGIEVSTGRRLSQVVTDAMDHSNEVAVWIGPGHVEEFLRGVPNCMVIDSGSEMAKQEVIRAFSSELIRFYFGRDLVGSEIGAAAKNVIGIAAGMLDGLALATLKGALMSRGTREIARLIEAMGGEAESAYGLCHLGDYEATLFSPHSHNRAFGEAFVTGAEYHRLAEGVPTAKALRNLGKAYGVELPICGTVYRILYENADPRHALDLLFTRQLKDEF